MTSDILRKTADRQESKITLSIETRMFHHHLEEYIMMALLALSLDIFEVMKTPDKSFMSSLHEDTLE